MKNNVTIQDIANALGLSRNTVSKALNGKHVPVKTRNAVISAAIEMGYKGYKLAATSEGSQGHRRFVILSTRLLMNITFFISVLKGIEESLMDYDIDLVQFSITNPASFANSEVEYNPNPMPLPSVMVSLIHIFNASGSDIPAYSAFSESDACTPIPSSATKKLRM